MPALKLHNLDINDFLQHYWQKKPLIIRNALPDFQTPLTPDELAGLACEEDIESRLIVGEGNDWQLTLGPLEDEHFEELPEKNWTLLVQAVDHWVPEVADLREAFNFIPNWRIDDVMASYASEGGSVGPHYDNYDVFLVQGLGQRQWKVGQLCDASSPLLAHEQLKLLRDFDSTDEWLLNPGDILYIPPCIAHWGVGKKDDCMTYSIGFKAPSHAEILANFCDEKLSYLDDQKRYKDESLDQYNQTTYNPGAISETAINQIQSILKTLSEDRNSISEWFGRYMTEPKYAHLHEEQSAEFDESFLSKEMNNGATLHRNPASRFAFYQQENKTTLFVDGVSYPCTDTSKELALLLCDHSTYDTETVSDFISDVASNELLTILINQGCLFFE